MHANYSVSKYRLLEKIWLEKKEINLTENACLHSSPCSCPPYAFLACHELSQNHRMCRVGRDRRVSSGPTSLIKQSHPRACIWHRIMSQKFFYFFSVRESPHLLVRWNFLCTHLWMLCFVLLLGSTEQSLDPSSALSHQTLTLTRSPSQLSLLKAAKSHLPQPFLIREMLLFLSHLCSPSLASHQELHFSLVLRRSELDTAVQMCLTRAE